MNKYVSFYSKNKIIKIVCCKTSMSIEEEKNGNHEFIKQVQMFIWCADGYEKLSHVNQSVQVVVYQKGTKELLHNWDDILW